MENLPFYVYLVFGITVLIALYTFYQATNFSKTALTIICVWMIIQTEISLSGFYKDTSSIPPRVSLLLVPPLIMTIVLFSTLKGRTFIDGLDIRTLTLFHIIRIPVELTLFWLFLNKSVPELMTFEGRNFDILSGISAPIIYYFVFIKKKMSHSGLLIWNFVCLALLFNIVFNAILSIPGVFQKFAFDQPNVAITVFPFVFLPSVLVPMVLFSHIAAIRRILLKKENLI